jgi:SRSO17 transposase
MVATLMHADRAQPARWYLKGLLLPGERKSVEPMAARVQPQNVRQAHQSMHHLVADAPWSDETMLSAVTDTVLPALVRDEEPVHWIVDDTGFPKKGKHSVGVARQYCGQTGKQDNCRVAVSLSMATARGSVPVGFRLYLPREWTDDVARCRKAGGNLPANTPWQPMIDTVMGRWRIERDYEELKQELGLGHFEGRNWRGFHHHASLCIAAYGFLMLERLSGSKKNAARFKTPSLPEGFRPRGAQSHAAP